jgi:hypothetical protein
MDGNMNGMGELLYETSDIAYDTVTKQYLNPKTNSIYGDSPPVGGWAITWYQGADKVPVVVSGNQTVAQIQSQLATPVVTSVGNPVPQGSVSWVDGTTFGVNNMLLVGGVVVIGLFMMNKRGR